MIIDTRKHKAKKDYQCDYCGEKIPAVNYYIKNVHDDPFGDTKLHPECNDACSRSCKECRYGEGRNCEECSDVSLNSCHTRGKTDEEMGREY